MGDMGGRAGVAATRLFWVALVGLLLYGFIGDVQDRRYEERHQERMLELRSERNELAEKVYWHVVGLNLPAPLEVGDCVSFPEQRSRSVPCGSHDAVVSSSGEPGCAHNRWANTMIVQPEDFGEWSITDYVTDEFGPRYDWFTYWEWSEYESYVGEKHKVCLNVVRDTPRFGGHWGVGPVQRNDCLRTDGTGRLTKRVRCTESYNVKVTRVVEQESDCPYGNRFYRSVDGSPAVLCFR